MRFRRAIRIANAVSVSVDLAVSRSALAQGNANAPPPQLDSVLGLVSDSGYSSLRSRQRDDTISRLSGCCPAGSPPEAFAGYLGESAMRLHDTLEAVDASLRELKVERPRILEIGSNPYFFTLLLAERFPKAEHLGVNYFGATTPGFETQGVVDPKRRLTESRFFHADIERHDLAPTGEFDLVVFCEVLEHLPYDPAWALYNVLRRVRPGGQLIVTTPNPARMENIVKMVTQRETFSDPISAHGIHGRHNREYSERELRELLESAGARVLAQQTIEVIPGPLMRSIETRGYGAYHLLRAVAGPQTRLSRPEWLYRGYPPETLAQPHSLVGATA